MKENYIDSAKQILIKKHGENTEKQVGRYTYKNINIYLNTFESFIQTLDEVSKIYNVTFSDDVYALICEYCKECEYYYLDKIIKKFKSGINKFNKEGSIDKVFYLKLKKISQDLEIQAQTKDAKIWNVEKIFNHYLNISTVDPHKFVKKSNYASSFSDNDMADVLEHMADNN